MKRPTGFYSFYLNLSAVYLNAKKLNVMSVEMDFPQGRCLSYCAQKTASRNVLEESLVHTHHIQVNFSRKMKGPENFVIKVIVLL